MGKLRIRQVRSSIGAVERQRATLASLGLRRIRHVVEKDDRPEIRGMIRKVSHLVEVEEVSTPRRQKTAKKKTEK